MAQGKFSKPRPHRDEERQIEETFRQLTGQAPIKKAPIREVSPMEETQKIPTPAPNSIPQSPYHPPIENGSEEAFPQCLEDAVLEQFREPEAVPRSAGGAYAKRPERPQQSAVEFPYDEMLLTEEPTPEEEDFLDKTLGFFQKNKKLVTVFACAAALFLLVGAIALFFLGGTDPYDNLILDNVYIADIHVGGLTKKEASTVLTQATSQTFTQVPMVINLAGHEVSLAPTDTKAKLNVSTAVEAAYAIGRTGTEDQRQEMVLSLRTHPQVIALLSHLELEEEFILTTLRSYAENAGSTLTQPSYGLEGTKPELSAEKFNKDIPPQTLVITLGIPGIGFDYQDVYDQVLDAYSLNRFLVNVEDVESVKEPDPIDLEEIYQEFYIAPVDATVNLQTFKPIPGSYGYEFDLEEAQKLLDAAEPGQELRIPMMYVEPKILDADMLFRDVLGESTLTHTSHKDRNHNLELACEAINGTMLDPGEQFSFNQVVGERSSGNGYKRAYEVLRREPYEEDGIIRGGGVSQVASALYTSALLADMQIDYRVSQDFAPDYAQGGLDAYVDWRSPDLQFTNISDYPIRIEATATDGKVTIRIYGTDERDYYIKMETNIASIEKPGTKYQDYPHDNEEQWKDGDVVRKGIQGFNVKTYKCKYDKSSGQLISRDFEASSKYRMVDEILARVKAQPTTEATEPPTVPPVETDPPATEPVTQPPTQPPTTEGGDNSQDSDNGSSDSSGGDGESQDSGAPAAEGEETSGET